MEADLDPFSKTFTDEHTRRREPASETETVPPTLLSEFFSWSDFQLNLIGARHIPGAQREKNMALDFLKSLDADDIFISYSRDDGEAYLTGLDAALSNLGFSCFTDKRGTDANDNPPPTLFRKIRTCKTLVLLGTPGALRKSKNIMPEVQEFADANATNTSTSVSIARDF